MNWVIEQGWAFYWGTSMWSAADIQEAYAICDRLGLIRPICEQPEYNIFARTRMESEYLPLFRNHGMGVTTYSPLASGVLTGKYKGGQVPEGTRLAVSAVSFVKDNKLGRDRYQIDKTEELRPVAEKLGCSLAQLAIAWTLKNDNCSVTLLGATKVAQLQENIKALEILPKLDSSMMEEIDQIVANAPAGLVVDQQVRAFRMPIAIHGVSPR